MHDAKKRRKQRKEDAHDEDDEETLDSDLAVDLSLNFFKGMVKTAFQTVPLVPSIVLPFRNRLNSFIYGGVRK